MEEYKRKYNEHVDRYCAFHRSTSKNDILSNDWKLDSISLLLLINDIIIDSDRINKVLLVWNIIASMIVYDIVSDQLA